MINSFEEWASRHPDAARELTAFLHSEGVVVDEGGVAESDAQKRVRVAIAKKGHMSWRNNVGATPCSNACKCPACGLSYKMHKQPVRYGLANESTKINTKFKSSDLILALRRVITAEDVGSTIAQFGSVEVKRPGWRYTGKGRESAQAAWLSLVNSIGGFACFSTGEIDL